MFSIKAYRVAWCGRSDYNKTIGALPWNTDRFMVKNHVGYLNRSKNSVAYYIETRGVRI